MTGQKQPRRFRPIRSLTRIIIGGAVLGAETLADRLPQWEHTEEGEPSQKQEAPSQAEAANPPSPAEDTQPADSSPQPAADDSQPGISPPQPLNPLPEQLPPPGLAQTPPPTPSEAAPQVGYALVGLIFEGEETLERWWNLSMRAGKLAARAADPLIKPLTKIPNPAKKPVDALAERGQSKIEQWTARGREETEQSLQVTQTAVTSTMDETIAYMAQNPALEELVQQQGMSLAQQMLEQVRQMCLSADYMLEGSIRYLLHRPPREMLPPPSDKVQTQANWRARDHREEQSDG